MSRGVGHMRSSIWRLGASGGRSIWVAVLVYISDRLDASISTSSGMLVDCVGECDATAHGLNLPLRHCDGDCLVVWGIMVGVVRDGHSLHWSVDVGDSDVLRCGGCVYAF